jgi:hypothetical protein
VVVNEQSRYKNINQYSPLPWGFAPSSRGLQPHGKGDTGCIAVLRYVDPCLDLPCRARRPLPAEWRRKFISVIASGAPFPGVFNLVHQVRPLWENAQLRERDAIGWRARNTTAPQNQATPCFISVLVQCS